MTLWRDLVYLIFFCLFLRERERERETGHKQGRGRERRGQKIPSRLLTDSKESDMGLKLTNREIMTGAKGRHLTD